MYFLLHDQTHNDQKCREKNRKCFKSECLIKISGLILQSNHQKTSVSERSPVSSSPDTFDHTLQCNTPFGLSSYDITFNSRVHTEDLSLRHEYYDIKSIILQGTSSLGSINKLDLSVKMHMVSAPVSTPVHF